MIQILENFVSIAIQGTQVPMYTNTLFLYFSDFSNFLLFIFYEKKNETKLKINKQKHVKNSKA